MADNRVGNERQQNDNMIAVKHAVRLSDCHFQLAHNYADLEMQPSDYVTAQMEMYRNISAHLAPDERARWIKASIMSDKSTSNLRHAINSGRLPIWRIHNAQEVSLTPILLDNGNINYGIYKAFQHPEPDMQGAYLWVKENDWQIFLAAVTPQRPRHAGRPNKRNEALQLHESRVHHGNADPITAGEARAIHAMLAERHKGDPNWSYAVESIAKALRDKKSA